jgi:heme-degrading monooxygenase HmoA
MPYVRIAWGKLSAGSWDQYENFFNEKVAVTTQTINGLQMRALLPSTEAPDEGISISMWETLEDLQNYERSDKRQSLAREMEHFYTGEYWVKHFELVSVTKP